MRVEPRDAGVSGVKLRDFKFASQPEGCVADDEAGQVFLGEEKRGVRALPTDARTIARPKLVLPVGGLLHADVEGMGLYRGTTQSWLVVASQGNNASWCSTPRRPIACAARSRRHEPRCSD